MKKLVKVIAIMLVVSAMFAFTACGTYGKVEKAFLNKGYTVSETTKGVVADITKELEKDELAVTPHILTKTTNIVIVIEFKATDDIVEYVKSSNTAQGMLKDIAKDEDAKALYNALEEKGYVNGNCLVLSVIPSQEVKDIVKNA